MENQEKITLSDEERKMKLGKLCDHLETRGYKVSRVTAWRAKRDGYFVAGRKAGGSQFPKVDLTEDERRVYPEFLAKRFNIALPTAKDTLRRGWFAANPKTATIPEDRNVPPEALGSQKVQRVELTDEEREAFPEFLAERFGLSSTTANKARKRGWFEVDEVNRDKVRNPEDRSMPALFPGKKIHLTADEKQMRDSALVDRFGITRFTARDAKKRGYFVVTASNIGSVKVPVERSVSEDLKKPARRGRRSTGSPKPKKGPSIASEIKRIKEKNIQKWIEVTGDPTLTVALQQVREEEQKRRMEAARREEEILKLIAEQRADQKGTLWGEVSFQILSFEDELPTDVEARFCKDTWTPERQLVVKELFAITQGACDSENEEIILNSWLQKGATLETVARDHGLPLPQVAAAVTAVLSEVRRVVGENPNRFPFSQNRDLVTMVRNYLKGGDKVLAGEVFLSDEEKTLPLDALWSLLRQRGYNVSRSFAWRAKRDGYFVAGRKAGGSQFPKVDLTEDERRVYPEFLAKRFNIALPTARDAKRRGWFRANPKTATVPEDRNVPPEALGSQKVARVELTAEERGMSRSLVAKRFNIGLTTADCAKKQGYFEVDGTNRDRVNIPSDRTVRPQDKDRIPLTEDERNMRASALAARFGITRGTAIDAKRRGYIGVVARNRNTLVVPVDRSVTADQVEPGRRGRRPKSQEKK